MPARTIQGDLDGWQRVAEKAYRRRASLDLTGAGVVERSGNEISLKLVSWIENARQTSYMDRKVRAFSRALGWTDDSIELILKGGEPIELPPEPVGEDASLAAQLADLRRQSADLQRQFAAFVAKWEPLLVHVGEELELHLEEWGVRFEETQAGLRKPAQPGAAPSPQRGRREA